MSAAVETTDENHDTPALRLLPCNKCPGSTYGIIVLNLTPEVRVPPGYSCDSDIQSCCFAFFTHTCAMTLICTMTPIDGKARSLTTFETQHVSGCTCTCTRYKKKPSTRRIRNAPMTLLKKLRETNCSVMYTPCSGHRYSCTGSTNTADPCVKRYRKRRINTTPQAPKRIARTCRGKVKFSNQPPDPENADTTPQTESINLYIHALLCIQSKMHHLPPW